MMAIVDSGHHLGDVVTSRNLSYNWIDEIVVARMMLHPEMPALPEFPGITERRAADISANSGLESLGFLFCDIPKQKRSVSGDGLSGL